MARKHFNKKINRKTKYKLSPKDADIIIKKEFTDSKGNQMNVQFDITPQKINSPIFKWNRQYNKD